MPYILLLRLAAPMQSWGVMSRFSRRDTGREPSKSGVVGLLCAALGISRDRADAATNPFFAELVKLKMGVLALREGVLRHDYHTAQNIAKADRGTKETELSTRFYLADADFVVALAGERRETLDAIQDALRKPKWQLFLGRKAFAPAAPIYFREGILEIDDSENSLADFLKSERLKNILAGYEFGEKSFDGRRGQVRLVVESDQGSETRPDVPLSFAARQFTNRRVKTEFFKFDDGGEKRR